MDAHYSGVSEYTLNLIKEILRLDTENEYQLFYNCFGDCPGMPDFSGARVKVAKYNYPNKIINYLLFKIFNYPKIDKALGADIFFMPHINFIGLAGCAKSVITIHDLSFLRYPEFFSARKNFWHFTINVKKLVKKFDLIVAVSEHTKRDIIELCGVDENKIKVIYSGTGKGFRKILSIDADCGKLLEIKNKYNLPDKFILYLGTVEPRKNIEGIIAAYSEMRRAKSGLEKVRLIIAGSKGWKSKKIYKNWEQSEFKDDIKFLDYIAGEDKVYLYNLASVFIYPSFYEGFGLPPLEAMACGAPVVASYSSSLPEVIGDAGLLVDPYNIRDIARAMESILSDETLKNKLVERGLERSKKFSWENAAKQYLEIFNHA